MNHHFYSDILWCLRKGVQCERDKLHTENWFLNLDNVLAHSWSVHEFLPTMTRLLSHTFRTSQLEHCVGFSFSQAQVGTEREVI